MMRHSTSLTIMETQVKIPMRHYCIPIRIAKIKNTGNSKYCENAENLVHSLLMGMENDSHYGQQLDNYPMTQQWDLGYLSQRNKHDCLHKICTQMFIAALLIIDSLGNNPDVLQWVSC
jgi:hypothetical protein